MKAFLISLYLRVIIISLHWHHLALVLRASVLYGYKKLFSIATCFVVFMRIVNLVKADEAMK